MYPIAPPPPTLRLCSTAIMQILCFLGYPLSCTLGRSVLGIGNGVARFLIIAEYATYRYLRCVVNVMLLLSQLSVSFIVFL